MKRSGKAGKVDVEGQGRVLYPEWQVVKGEKIRIS